MANSPVYIVSKDTCIAFDVNLQNRHSLLSRDCHRMDLDCEVIIQNRFENVMPSCGTGISIVCYGTEIQSEFAPIRIASEMRTVLEMRHILRDCCKNLLSANLSRILVFIASHMYARVPRR